MRRLFQRRLTILTAVLVCLALFAGFSAETSSAASKPAWQTASLTIVKKGRSAFDFRTASGQKLYQYDTLQGACANKGYAYLTLYNRNVERCRIVKVHLKSLKVVRVSAPLPVYHANNLTYNTKKNLIVATCCKVKGNRAVFINPSTLTVAGSKDIKLTRRVKNLPKSVRKKYKGFTAIAYNAQKDCYVGRLRSNNNVIIFNGNLKPVRYVKLKGKKARLLNQGMESAGNYIYDVRSFKPPYKCNVVTVHTMKGKLVAQMKFPYGKSPGNELQCLFHDGRQFYAGYYYSTSQYHDTKANHVMRVNRIYRLNNLVCPQ